MRVFVWLPLDTPDEQAESIVPDLQGKFPEWFGEPPAGRAPEVGAKRTDTSTIDIMATDVPKGKEGLSLILDLVSASLGNLCDGQIYDPVRELTILKPSACSA